jgi:hypothetical protein
VIKEDVFYESLSTYGRNVYCIQNFSLKSLKGTDKLEHLHVHGLMALDYVYIYIYICKSVYTDMVLWRAVVNKVMNIVVPYK